MSTWSDPDELLTQLREAAAEFNAVELDRTCRELIADARTRTDPVDTTTALDVLKLLQAQRQISLVQDVAEALLAHGVDNVEVRHRYALALLDHDRTAAAESLLRTVRGAGQASTEIAGAIGRVHKQRYLTSGPAAGQQRAKDLGQAIEAYGATYRDDTAKNYYHGINAAALLVRASLDGVALPGHPDPQVEASEIATDILDSIRSTADPDQWQLATAAEACLVLGQYDKAFDWTDRYVHSPLNAFQCASTLRQFQLAWRLDTDSEPGLRLLPLLRNRLLQAEGGAITVSPSEFTPESLQRFDAVQDSLDQRSGVTYQQIYGTDQFQSVQWLREALEICRSVARIENKYGDGIGTGFVLAGHELWPGWPPRVLLTNAHVVPDALSVEDTFIAFRGLAATGPDAQVSVQAAGGEWLYLSPREEYDACILALPDTLSDQVVALQARKNFPVLGMGAVPRAYVIGHPLGGFDLKVSLHDTKLLAADARYAHYRSPTQRGSSGSPVFDEDWKVIALHHAAVGSYPGSAQPANEGIRFDVLRAVLRELGSTNG
jgi:hypothetical protein